MTSEEKRRELTLKMKSRIRGEQITPKEYHRKIKKGRKKATAAVKAIMLEPVVKTIQVDLSTLRGNSYQSQVDKIKSLIHKDEKRDRRKSKRTDPEE